MEPLENGSPLPAIMIVVAVLSVGTACFVGVGKWAAPQPASAIVQPMDRAPAVPQFQLGEIVRVKTSIVALPLAVTPQVAATDERLTLAGDGAGLCELVDARLVYPVKAEGKVRIIGFDADPEATRKLGSTATWVQVRVVGGENDGRAGWVDTDCLKR